MPSGSTSDPIEVLVPPARWERWLANFAERHGAATLTVVDGRLCGVAEDGSRVVAALPFSRRFGGPPQPEGFVRDAVPPADWGVVLVRKGGFAIARLAGERVVSSKVGQRHVQGRSKAGGWSQQRFARRRDNQARAAYEAAAGHTKALLGGCPAVVTGGDRAGVAEVLERAGLTGDAVPERRRCAVLDHIGEVPEPRRATLDQAIAAACSLRVVVTNC